MLALLVYSVSKTREVADIPQPLAPNRVIPPSFVGSVPVECAYPGTGEAFELTAPMHKLRWKLGPNADEVDNTLKDGWFSAQLLVPHEQEAFGDPRHDVPCEVVEVAVCGSLVSEPSIWIRDICPPTID